MEVESKQSSPPDGLAEDRALGLAASGEGAVTVSAPPIIAEAVPPQVAAAPASA